MRRKSKGNKGLGFARFSEVTAFYLAAGMENAIYIHTYPWLLLEKWPPPAYCVPLAQVRKPGVGRGKRLFPRALCPQHSRQKSGFLPHLMWTSVSCKHSYFTWVSPLCVWLFLFLLEVVWSRLWNAAPSATWLKSLFLRSVLLFFGRVII